ncbi:MAG: tyrosine-type recombinase/integrase [Anaerolineales bacterium]|jgi:site-specific recombinase XerD
MENGHVPFSSGADELGAQRSDAQAEGVGLAAARRGETIAHSVAMYVIAKTNEGLAPNTARIYAKHLTPFVRFAQSVGMRTVNGITADVIRAHLLALRQAGHDPGGRHQAYRSIKSWMRWVWGENDLTTINPISKVKPPPLHEKYLPPVSMEDVNALVRAVNHGPSPMLGARDKALVLSPYDTGCRVGELLAWNTDDLDEASRSLVIRNSKTGKVRSVFLGLTAGRAMRSWLRVHLQHAAALFCDVAGQRLTYSGLRRVLQRLAERADVKTPSPHSFRRGFATQFLRSGGNVVDLQ